jgi:small-conductance mechanosensitive channel
MAPKHDRWLSPELKRTIVTTVLTVALLVVAAMLNVNDLFRRGKLYEKFIAVGGGLVFLLVGALMVRAVARLAATRTQVRLGDSLAGVVRLVVSIIGYVCVAIAMLETLGVNLSQVLVGGAVTGVIIGIAAQQSLGNVFAGLVMVVTRPFAVGDHVVVHSGALGGPHEGRVGEMGLVYLTLETEQGPLRLPNSAVLNSGVAPRDHTPAAAPAVAAPAEPEPEREAGKEARTQAPGGDPPVIGS